MNDRTGHTSTTVEWQGRWSDELVKDRPDLVSGWVSCPDEETASCFSEKRKRHVLYSGWIYDITHQEV